MKTILSVLAAVALNAWTAVGADDSLRVFARRLSDDRDLYLGPAPCAKPILSDLRTDTLPAGEYAMILRESFVAEPENAVLHTKSGRALVELPGVELADFELKLRVSGLCNFAVRSQTSATRDSNTWRWFETRIARDGATGVSFVTNSHWTALSGAPIPRDTLGRQALHDVTLRAEGPNFTLTVDGETARFTAPAGSYRSGFFAFRTNDAGLGSVIDDVVITDLATGKVVFRDDFSGGLSPKWRVKTGDWQVAKGYAATRDRYPGRVTIAPKPRAEFATAKVVTSGDDQVLFVNGVKTLPLLYRCSIGQFAYNPDSYDVLRRAYEAGLRLFVPIVDGSDFTVLDDVLAQIRAVCPGAYILLSTSVPVPPDLPPGDHIRMMDGTGDATRQAGLDNSKAGNSVSLASVYFRTNGIPKLVKRLTEHLRASGHAPNVMGILVNGGGYEGGWGLGGMWPKFLLDLCDAQLAGYSRWLTAKYGSDAALRAAWGRSDVSLAAPKVPSWRERTVSDVAGFRDPSKTANRWVDDFLGYYRADAASTHKALYSAVRAAMPDSLVTSFGGGACLNSSFGIIQPRPPADAHGREDLAAMVSLETYGDRGKGGVSLNTNYGNESVRASGHVHVQELDMRPPGVETFEPGDWDAFRGALRREFAVQVLMRRDAMWYFDMGFTGPWYDHPAAYAEFAAEERVGRAWMNVPRRKATEVALVQDGRHQLFYAMTPTPWTGADDMPWGRPIHYNENYATHAPEGAVRLGAAVDGFNMNDLARFERDYKMYVFPTAGYMTSSERRRVRALAARGATVVLMGPAGLVDEKGASLGNMRELLGVKVAVGPIGPQRIFAVEGAGAAVAGLAAKDRLGAARWFDGAMDTDWHTFYVDDPSVKPLATYADGRTALVEIPVGRGRIVYSAVALTHPRVYRNLAKAAGAHVYLETDDFTYADGNFVTVHARTDGVKHVVLRGKAAEVREIFTGETVATDATSFDVAMKAGETRVWHLQASDRTAWPALDASARAAFDEIWAPQVVAVPPSDAFPRQLVATRGGVLKCFGIRQFAGRVKDVVLESRDWGLSWTQRLDEDRTDQSVECPWADYRLGVKTWSDGFCWKQTPGADGALETARWRVPELGDYGRLRPFPRHHRWFYSYSTCKTNEIGYVVRYMYSDDDGATWTKALTIPETAHALPVRPPDKAPRWEVGCNESDMVEWGDGRVSLVARTGTDHACWYDSTDGGATWGAPHELPAFWMSNTMPLLFRMRDGRVIFFWNNTQILPKPPLAETPELDDEQRRGRWESQFTNRDALHAAITEDDGKTWIGFREIALSAIRNREDYRESGNEFWQIDGPGGGRDKSVHQGAAVELPEGKIAILYGQSAASRRIAIFDVRWLYEKDRTENLRLGTANLSNHLYLKSLLGSYRGWSGHCSLNRIAGAAMVREPETGPDTCRECLQICRIRDERLVDEHQGVVWNFPAAKRGRVSFECRIDGAGVRLSLCDHWINPCDWAIADRAAATTRLEAADLGGPRRWATVTCAWDLDAGAVTLACEGRTRTFPLRREGFSPYGLSYLHLQTLAEAHDPKGTYFRWFKMESVR